MLKKLKSLFLVVIIRNFLQAQPWDHTETGSVKSVIFFTFEV